MVDVTVTIATWNRAELLDRCLSSVFASTGGVRYEVIVVDNASEDDTVAMLARSRPQVEVIRNAANRGFGAAHNQAMARARGRYVCALNNDAQLRPDTLAALTAFLDDHPRAGICSCPARPAPGASWATGGGVRRFPTVAVEAGASLAELLAPPFGLAGASVMKPVMDRLVGACPEDAAREVAWVHGALFMMRREMLDEVGGFDERFFMFFEEIDLCRRAWAGGWSVWFTPATSYLHLARQSSGDGSRREQMWHRSGAAYFEKYGGRGAAALFRVQDIVLRRWLLRGRRELGRALRREAAREVHA
jgi:GT2 family glycosyltransferase